MVFITDVCRATTLEERTPGNSLVHHKYYLKITLYLIPVLLLFNIAQQLGLLLGPACNLFLRELDFYIGPFHINKLNAPGFFLAVMYLLFELLAFLMYYDLKIAKEKSEQNEENSGIIANEEIMNEDIAEDSVDAIDTIVVTNETESVPWSRYADELLRGEIIALMFLRFIGLFGQTCLETIGMCFS